MLYLCRVCALPNLLNTVILLVNYVKNVGRFIHSRKFQKWLFFYYKMGGRLIHGVDLQYTRQNTVLNFEHNDFFVTSYW